MPVQHVAVEVVAIVVEPVSAWHSFVSGRKQWAAGELLVVAVVQVVGSIGRLVQQLVAAFALVESAVLLDVVGVIAASAVVLFVEVVAVGHDFVGRSEFAAAVEAEAMRWRPCIADDRVLPTWLPSFDFGC